jgi:hypothetical protein
LNRVLNGLCRRGQAGASAKSVQHNCRDRETVVGAGQYPGRSSFSARDNAAALRQARAASAKILRSFGSIGPSRSDRINDSPNPDNDALAIVTARDARDIGNRH